MKLLKGMKLRTSQYMNHLKGHGDRIKKQTSMRSKTDFLSYTYEQIPSYDH